MQEGNSNTRAISVGMNYMKQKYTYMFVGKNSGRLYLRGLTIAQNGLGN